MSYPPDRKPDFHPAPLFLAGARQGIALGFLGLWLLGSSAAGAEVRLRSTATSSSRIVRLADVAEIVGEPEIAGALADVALCPAPAVGQERRLSQEDVRGLLVLSGLERKDCIVTGSESVTVAGSTFATSGPRPRQPLVASGVRQALFEADAAEPKRVHEPKPAAKEPAPAAAASREAPLVERGATVTVSARTAGVRITTSGKALDAGKAGDAINVELADTKQRILATIVGVQSVEVSR